MCPHDIRLSVFERMDEEELELYNLMTAKFTNKGAKDMAYLIVGGRACSTDESWLAYKEAFKKLLDASKTWRAFKRGFKELDKLLVWNGIDQ